MHYDPDTGIYTIGPMKFRKYPHDPSRWERLHHLPIHKEMWMTLSDHSSACELLDYLEQNNYFTNPISIDI